jgi:hypothetical protein
MQMTLKTQDGQAVKLLASEFYEQKRLDGRRVGGGAAESNRCNALVGYSHRKSLPLLP